MADEVDATMEREVREHHLIVAASRKYEGAPPSGFCHYCDEGVAPGRRYCGPECHTDHADELRLKAIGGRK